MKNKVINTEVISKLRPCEDRFDNYIQHYADNSFTLQEFIDLENITHNDKIWVLLRVASDDTKVVFAIDCSFRTNKHAANTATYAAYATCAANAAASAAVDAANTAAANAAAANAAASAEAAGANRDKEERLSLEILVYLINNEGE